MSLPLGISVQELTTTWSLSAHNPAVGPSFAGVVAVDPDQGQSKQIQGPQWLIWMLHHQSCSSARAVLHAASGKAMAEISTSEDELMDMLARYLIFNIRGRTAGEMASRQQERVSG